jgi:hypothetical protein
MMSAVLTAAPTKKFTPDDLFRLPDRGKGFELIDGELQELNVSYRSSFMAGRFFRQLALYVEPNKLGDPVLPGFRAPVADLFRLPAGTTA